MHYVFLVVNFASIVLIGIALGFCITWQDRKEKRFFVAFLALLLAGHLIPVLGALIQSGMMDFSSAFFGVYSTIAGLSSILALVFLLVFTSVSRSVTPGAVSGGSVNPGGSRLGESRWSWSFLRGIGWALPVAGGALFGVKKTLANSVAIHGDYSPLLLVFAAAGIAFWLGGYRRTSKQTSAGEADIRQRVGDIQPPKTTKE